MNKLYEKNEILFAVAWIVIYCVISGTLRGSFGDESPWMLLGLAVITAGIAAFISRNHLQSRYGLDSWPHDWKKFWYFIPMWILTTGNLWGGVSLAYSGIYQVCAVLSMALIGYIEEVIFRGFLFKALLKKDGETFAVIVSAVTFGIGHIVNLFSGQTSLETVMQVPFAIAWGFIFTMVFFKSGSLLPGILAHSLVDVFSKFSVDDPAASWCYVIATIIVAVVYCLYLRKLDTPDENKVN